MLNNSHVKNKIKINKSTDIPSEDIENIYDEGDVNRLLMDSYKLSKEKNSTESLRFPSSSDLVQCVEDTGRLAISKYAEAHKRGYTNRKKDEEINKEESKKEFMDYINKL